nr:Rha family transcriptional regulator [Paenibacillus larvae]
MNQLVFIENGKTVTDSLTVAEVFGKRHDNVVQDIKNLECSQEFSLLNFQESTYTNERGRTYPKYIITQDGFSFLVMGYTGKKALQEKFKEMYIAEGLTGCVSNSPATTNAARNPASLNWATGRARTTLNCC